jgi:gas vesicle protein
MKKALYLILTGIAVGILIAPRKGSETWQKLKESFDDWKDDAKDHVNDFISQGKDMAVKGKVMANTLNDEARSAVNKW